MTLLRRSTRFGRNSVYKVILAPGAKQELCNALAYIKRKLRNPPAASHLADDAKTTLRNLRSLPERYPFCEDPVLRLQGYHRASVGKYLFIFRITKSPNQVRVVHFFHESQDYLVSMQMESPSS